jgi:predicted ester cyclase
MDSTESTRLSANKEVVRRIFEECFNQGNHALCDEFVSPRFVGPHGTGPDGLRGTIAFVEKMYGDARYTIELLIAEGDLVAVRWTLSGTHHGPIFGTTPTGKPLVNQANAFYRLENGKIVETWLQSDQVGLLEQLGALPAGLNIPRPQRPPPAP